MGKKTKQAVGARWVRKWACSQEACMCKCVCVRPVGLVGARERCDNLSHHSPLRSHMALLCPLLHARLKRPRGDLISTASGFSCMVRCTLR